jgi:hypothetical protein
VRRSLRRLAAILLLTGGAEAASVGGIARILDQLPWRNIGPAVMGGRIDDLAVVESDPTVIYVATASGGPFKTLALPHPGCRSELDPARGRAPQRR